MTLVEPLLGSFTEVSQGDRQKRKPLILDTTLDGFYVQRGASATSHGHFMSRAGPE